MPPKPRLSKEQYYAEIRACAGLVDNEVRVRKKNRTAFLRHTADSHPWVLDLGMNLEVLRITANDSAYFSVYGPMLALNFADAMYKMTLLAFEADIAEALAELEGETLCL
jgi:hypothetical protein